MSVRIINGKNRPYFMQGFRGSRGSLAIRGIKSQRRKINSINDDDIPDPVSYTALFQFASITEKLCLLLGMILIIISACLPCIVNILYGEFANMLIDRHAPRDGQPSSKTYVLKIFGGGQVLKNASEKRRREVLKDDGFAWGVGCFGISLLQTILIMLGVFITTFIASLQIKHIKTIFFESVLCKDLAWFDRKMKTNFFDNCQHNLLFLERGIGDTLAVFIYQTIAGLTNLLISFLYSWMLSLVLSLLLFPLMIPIYIQVKVQSKLTLKEYFAYNRARDVLDEVVYNIKTVVAFEGEKKELERYTATLEESKKIGLKREMMIGISQGVLWFIIYNCYTVVFAVGFRLVVDARKNQSYNLTPGDLFTVFFGMVMGVVNFGFGTAYVSNFTDASASAANIFHVISTKSRINPCTKEGATFKSCSGVIEFKNVHFEYPLKPRHKVLKGLNLKFKPGEVVAILGQSNVGKSTILNMIHRFYDPTLGSVCLDGFDVSRFNVTWVRKQIGYVGPEPYLFDGTIYENIAFGASFATEEEVLQAAKKADCHDFIMKLENDYSTFYDKKTSTLTGSQMQKIALARALVRNPKILILDEITSNLDPYNESSVLSVVRLAAQGRTTLIATKKVSTVSIVDRILVIEDGNLVEEGTHDELLKARGTYYKLLQAGKDKYGSELENENEKSEKPLREVSSAAKTIPSTRKIDSFGADYPPVSYRKILTWNRPNWLYVTVGVLSAIIGGMALPAACLMFGDAFMVLSLKDGEAIVITGDTYAVSLAIIASIAGICIFLQMFCFSVGALKMSHRLRIRAFECILKQEIAWFERHIHDNLNSIRISLAQDPVGVQMGVGSSLGLCLQSSSSMLIGICLSCYIEWRIALVTLATLPIIIIGIFVESFLFKEPSEKEIALTTTTAEIAKEATSNIKIISAYSKEFTYMKKYKKAVQMLNRVSVKESWIRGISFALSQTAPFYSYALVLWYGTLLVSEENIPISYPIIVSELLIFGAWTLAQCAVFAPFFYEARKCGGRLTYFFDRKPLIVDGPVHTMPDFLKGGQLAYSKVFFAYPNAPDVNVLQGTNLTIKFGDTIGIIGPTGSGKSTLFQLLLRFYDPKSGFINVNDVDIRNYTLSSLRKRLGIVTEEPTIFNLTVEENIAYGDNSRTIPFLEIERAAKAANIHEFILDLPRGYDTPLAPFVNKLTKGQKQKIAIARVLVRKPQLLILDDPTSAFDSRSEEIFQKTIEKNFKKRGKTVVAIGNKLKSIKTVDTVAVVSEGAVKESGTPNQLMQSKGIFFSLQSEKTEEKDKPGTSRT